MADTERLNILLEQLSELLDDSNKGSGGYSNANFVKLARIVRFMLVNAGANEEAISMLPNPNVVGCHWLRKEKSYQDSSSDDLVIASWDRFEWHIFPGGYVLTPTAAHRAGWRYVRPVK